MNKRLFNQQNLTRRLRLLSVLCAMLLMPFSAWAVDYDIIVGGVQVTSDNAANITGGQISDGKVSFDAENNILTLNGAIIDMSNTGQYPIQSSLANLTIKLEGDNNIFTVNADKPNAVKGPGTGTLTFTTNVNPKRCPLTVEGISATASLASGYTVSNTFETRDYDIIGPGEEAEDGWKVRIFDKDPTYGDQVIIWNFKNYNLFIGDCRINSDNLASAHSGVLPYNPETHTLPIPYYLGYDVKSGLEELIIEVSDENTINASDYSKPAIRFEAMTGGPTSGTLKFVKAADADLASITLTTDSEHKAIEGFAVDNIIITAPLQLKTPDSMSDILNATTVKIANYNEAYDIRIAGTTVTDANKDDVFDDGTVSLTVSEGQAAAPTYTLTLNNASIIPETEDAGIAYMGETGLTIRLIGTNTVKGIGGCPAIAYYGQLETVPSLTFTKGDQQACSVELEAVGETAIDAFTINHDGLFMLNDSREENETRISTTTITSTLFGGGSGTAQDPFLLKTKEDVRNFAKYINNMSISSGASFQLYNDIDCDGLTGYEAAGNDNNPFSGVFDGNKKTISNLTAQDGLFHTIGGATIKDLTLSGCTITGTTGSNAAGIAVETTMSASTIQNCSVVNSTIACKADANNPTVGGILAQSYGATVTGCTIDNVQVKAETTYALGNIAQGVAGGIVGNASGGEITSCEVKNGSKITDYNAKETATLKAGAIVGDYYGTTLSANYYYYDVNVETLTGTDTENKVTKSGYTQRAVGGTTYNEQTQQEEDNPDFTANNGAVMYTKALTVGISNEFESDYYEPFTNYENGIFAFAPDQTIDIDLFPADGVIISAASLVYTPTGGEEQTVALTNTAEDPGYYSYSFEMPDADATLNAILVQPYNLWIGDTQVTSENADDVLGDDGSVTFTVSGGQAAAPTYTLTLNDAALTVPVKVGLSNLTIDIHGSNTITTNTTCIQNVAEKVTPSLTFKSTSDVVGSLILTKGGDGRISDIGEGYITVSNELAVSLTVYGTEDYTSRLYYITDGSTTVAKIVPGYGVTINEKQVHAGNAANVLGDDDNVTVSFDEETATLTLNNASGISTISTSLSTLNIDLIGSNSLYRSSDGSILESLSGEDATIYLESTSATGVLTIKAPTNYGATIIGEDVTLTPVAPVVLLSSDVENNKGTLMYGVSYGLTVDGVPVTIANAGDVKNDDGTVKFDGRNRLVLNNASLAGITVGTTNTLPESELEIYLGGNSTIANNDGYAVESANAAASVKLAFLTGGDAPGTLTYTNGGEASENVFPGFDVSYRNNLARTTEANVTTVKTPLQLIVDEVASTAQTTTSSISYSEPAPADEPVTTNALKNLIVRNVLYTLNDLGTAESPDGYDQTKKLLVINSTMTDAQVQQVHEKVMSGECHPSLPSMGGQPSFEDYFKGLTFMVPAGEGVIGINSETAEGFEFHLKIGGQPAIKVKKTNITYFIHYSVTENSFVYLYLVATGTSAPAYAQSNGGHRIGPKSSVSGALGGLSVQSNSVSTAPDASASYLMMSVHDFAPVVGSHGVKVNNADVTDMPDGAFAMSIGPAPRRAPDANMMTFIDASDTKITGKSFSRTEGAFKGVPEETLIYLPAGNTAVGKNFIIGGICEDMELKGNREDPFEAAADFTAARATFDREFTEGEVGTEKKCYTIFLPYALEIGEVGGELWEYAGYDSANETVKMTQVVATSDNKGWTTPNTVYFFKPSKNGALKPMLSTQVKKFTGTVAEPDNEAEADGMHGVYEYYKWTTKPSNVYCYSASDKDGIEAGEFAKVGVDTYINPFRAYLRLSTSSAPEFLSITWGDGTTSIVPLDKEQVRQDADGWYTITGFRLPSKPTEKGIYIHNSKKTIVK